MCNLHGKSLVLLLDFSVPVSVPVSVLVSGVSTNTVVIESPDHSPDSEILD